MGEYNPKKFDVNAVDFPEALEPLVDVVAESVHDTWAAERIAAGWNYGPQRDDAKKLHPCLIPYADLPKSEKVYDIETAKTVIAMLLAKGCRIELPTWLLDKSANAATETLEQPVDPWADVSLNISWGTKFTQSEGEKIEDWISLAHRALVDLKQGDPRIEQIKDIANRIRQQYPYDFFMPAGDLLAEVAKKL